MVRLLETSLIRVGNAEYRTANGSFGLTTLRSRHVKVEGTSLRFEFRGKGGKQHVVDVADRRLARVVRRCQDLPGHELFQYVDDDGQRHTISSGDVNAYLRETAGEEFTAKDFRTWAGTVLAASALAGKAPESETDAKRNVVEAIRAVAARLGNTAAICRKCYVHPGVVESYLGGTLDRIARRGGRRSRATGLDVTSARFAAPQGLRPARSRARHAPTPDRALGARAPLVRRRQRAGAPTAAAPSRARPP